MKRLFGLFDVAAFAVNEGDDEGILITQGPHFSLACCGFGFGQEMP